jgi:hypothetical protein
MTDWQVGDKAVCVDASPGAGQRQPFRSGGAYIVSGVMPAGTYVPGVGTSKCVTLSFKTPEEWGCAARRFRKLLPDKHEACNAEFVTLLKRGKVSA